MLFSYFQIHIYHIIISSLNITDAYPADKDNYIVEGLFIFILLSLITGVDILRRSIVVILAISLNNLAELLEF